MTRRHLGGLPARPGWRLPLGAALVGGALALASVSASGVVGSAATLVVDGGVVQVLQTDPETLLLPKGVAPSADPAPATLPPAGAEGTTSGPPRPEGAAPAPTSSEPTTGGLTATGPTETGPTASEPTATEPTTTEHAAPEPTTTDRGQPEADEPVGGSSSTDTPTAGGADELSTAAVEPTPLALDPSPEAAAAGSDPADRTDGLPDQPSGSGTAAEPGALDAP